MIADLPIPGSFLRGGVADGYVTISGPSARVIMLVQDAYALMHWMYDVLPAPTAPAKPIFLNTNSRMLSYSDLWIRRRLAA